MVVAAGAAIGMALGALVLRYLPVWLHGLFGSIAPAPWALWFLPLWLVALLLAALILPGITPRVSGESIARRNELLNWCQQILRVLVLGVHSGLSRPRHVLLTIAGLLIAALTLLTVLTIPAGLKRIAAHTGRADVAVILGSSRGTETDGRIAPELVDRIGALPGVALHADGSPRISPQFVIHAKLARHDGRQTTAIVRGVTPSVWDVVDGSVRITTGTRFDSGLNALASGVIAAHDYVYATTGSTLNLRRSNWQVSGEFDSGGSLWESEIWADMSALQAAYNAQGQISTVWVRLNSPSSYGAFARALQSDPRLRNFPHMPQHAFYAQRVGYLAMFVRVVAWLVATVLGLMAILASNNAISLALRARRRELAVLRATGFGTGVLYTALVVEIMLIAALCATIATGSGLLFLNGRAIDSSTLDTAIHFTTVVTPGVAFATLGYAVLLGLISAIVPAWRALHAPLVKALARE